jgi:GT2 family glycosyltransferase
MPDEILLSVIIVSYNTRAITLDCLRSLYASIDGLSAEVWLVDNGSTDQSVNSVTKEFPAVRIIANQGNLGFGAANNQAMSRSRGKLLLLLNSDAFPLAGAISALIAYLDANPAAAAVGPRLLNLDGSLQRSCWRFPSPMQAWRENLGITSLLPNHPVFGDYYRWKHDSERQVDFVIGACLLVRHEVYERIGGFDERFFMYAEECDWQRRMADHGWKVAFIPHAEVTHLGGASGAGEQARINRHFFDSLDLYTKKHHGLLGLISLRVGMTIGCLARGLVWGILSLVPKLRVSALAKTRLHFWLLFRQATSWRLAADG